MPFVLLIWPLICGLLNSAQALDLPEFSFSPNAGKTSRVPFANNHITHFRVQIFPHFGGYSAPQGREASASSVEITSSEACQAYEAVLDKDLEWTKGKSLSTPRALSVKLKAGAAKQIFYACAKPFTVNRASNLKSIEYSGDFVAVISSKQVKVVNIIDPETYLMGVIPAEVSSGWPMEVLKAQAVAARTYAWWTVVQTRLSQSDSDMDDTVLYQAYLGNSNRVNNSDLATAQTQGLVMLYNGQIIKSYFSADSGGYTEKASEVFEDLPYCQANPETYNLSVYSDTFWKSSFTSVQLRADLVNQKLIPSGVTIRDIQVPQSERTASGRARTIQVIASNGKIYSVNASDFRYATKIRSNLFDVVHTDASYEFNGKGYGHGVGMAQIGALEYANQLKWTYDKILSFYYNGVTITHD